METIKLKSTWPTVKKYAIQLIAWSIPATIILLFSNMHESDSTVGLLDAGIWQLIVLGSIFFLILSALAWWLLQSIWTELGLPKIEEMVLQFKELTLCQQFAFYWASFALLLLAAVMSLIAVF